MSRKRGDFILRILSLSICLVLLNAVVPTGRPSAADRQPPPQNEAKPSPQAEEPVDPELAPILKSLAEKSAVYESIALRFVCIETTRDSDDPLDEKTYDYMYVEAEVQRYRPYRQRHSARPRDSSSEIEVETNFPDSYSWTLLFAPNRQHLFHFKNAGVEWFSLRKAQIIEFIAPLPYTTGRTIYEWSGKVWVDAENFNFLKVEAVPSNQEERLKQLLRDYRTAPRFLVYPMARRPAGGRYEITFLNEYQRLSLPDQAEYREFLLDLEGTAQLTSLRTHRYSQYQFFGVQLEDRFLK